MRDCVCLCAFCVHAIVCVLFQLSPDMSRLPDVVAYKYSVCGTVSLGSMPSHLQSQISKRRRIDVRRSSSASSEVTYIPYWHIHVCVLLMVGFACFGPLLGLVVLYVGLALQPITSDDNGRFCWFATPGVYTFTAVVSDAERSAGLIFSPAESRVSVTAESVRRCVSRGID